MKRCRGRGLSFLVIFALLLAINPAASGQAGTFDIDVKAAILIDADTGQVLYEKNADEVRAPASLVKIMTLLVVMDAVKAGQVSLSDEVRASARAAGTGGSQVWLSAGEVHSLEKMLKAIAIASANDASVAVAEYISGTEAAFTTLMNARARQLGLTKTVFGNADGLPAAAGEVPSTITAREIAVVARELINKHPEVLQWTSTVTERFRDQPLFIMYNTNSLVGKYDGLDGLKTGHTSEAGYNLVATAKRGDVRVISVVLGADSADQREQLTRSLLDYGLVRHAPVTVARDYVGDVRVRNAIPERVPVRVAEPVRVLQLRGANVRIETRIEAAGASAPFDEGDRVGDYVVLLDGKEALRVPVYADTEVRAANVFVRLWRAARDFFVGLLPGSR